MNSNQFPFGSRALLRIKKHMRANLYDPISLVSSDFVSFITGRLGARNVLKLVVSMRLPCCHWGQRGSYPAGKLWVF